MFPSVSGVSVSPGLSAAAYEKAWKRKNRWLQVSVFLSHSQGFYESSSVVLRVLAKGAKVSQFDRLMARSKKRKHQLIQLHHGTTATPRMELFACARRETTRPLLCAAPPRSCAVRSAE